MAAMTTSVTHEIKSSNVSAQTMFKAIVEEGNATYSTVFPQLINTVETIQGDGGPGTIFSICFIDSVTAEEMTWEIKVDVVDSANLYSKYTLMTEAGEVVVNELKFETAEGAQGCICKLTSNYVKKDEGIHSGVVRLLRIYNKVFDYMSSANLDVCA